MENNIILLIQIIVALGLLNVWLLRFNKQTAYRGKDAKNIKEEFAAYGLPSWFCYLIGALKVSAAIVLLIGLWHPSITLYASALISFLMIGAIMMHFKVHDPVKKTLPAAIMLLLSLILSFSYLNVSIT